MPLCRCVGTPQQVGCGSFRVFRRMLLGRDQRMDQGIVTPV